PCQVGPRDEPAQASITGIVAGQQDEMGSALRRRDPPEVLLDHVAVAGQTSPNRSRSNRPTFVGKAGGGRRSVAAPNGSPGPDDDPPWIGNSRVDELDLHPQHRPNACLTGGRREPDDAV